MIAFTNAPSKKALRLALTRMVHALRHLVVRCDDTRRCHQHGELATPRRSVVIIGGAATTIVAVRAWGHTSAHGHVRGLCETSVLVECRTLTRAGPRHSSAASTRRGAARSPWRGTLLLACHHQYDCYCTGAVSLTINTATASIVSPFRPSQPSSDRLDVLELRDSLTPARCNGRSFRFRFRVHVDLKHHSYVGVMSIFPNTSAYSKGTWYSSSSPRLAAQRHQPTARAHLSGTTSGEASLFARWSS
jgi:hypothetical protein